MKGRYISHQHTSIQITQTDIQGMICTPRRNDGHPHGMYTYPISRYKEVSIQIYIEQKIKRNKHSEAHI